MEPGSGDIVPLRRELPLPLAGKNVYLDVLAVTRSGRLVLIECKLWRNPQARREVIAQILEYASLLRGWTYGDLTVQIDANVAMAPNTVFELARRKWPDLDEARFVDGVARSLSEGDFNLVLAGDGMRSELHRISDHLNSSGLRAARFSMLEIQIWQSPEGSFMVVPVVPLTTKVIEHRVITDVAGRMLPVASGHLDDPETAPTINPDRQGAVARARAFWDAYLQNARFDHPDQPPPRHGGVNWVKIPLPQPVRWITAYREGTDSVGMYVRFPGEEGRDIYARLQEHAEALRSESGLQLEFDD